VYHAFVAVNFEGRLVYDKARRILDGPHDFVLHGVLALYAVVRHHDLQSYVLLTKKVVGHPHRTEATVTELV
jgi:hypothetical protein